MSSVDQYIDIEDLLRELAGATPGGIGGGLAGQPRPPMMPPPSPGPMIPPVAGPSPAIGAGLAGPMSPQGPAPTLAPPMMATPPTSNQFPPIQRPQEGVGSMDKLAMAALIYGALAKNRGVLQGVAGYAGGRAQGMEKRRGEYRQDVQRREGRMDVDRQLRQQMGHRELMAAKGRVHEKGMVREQREHEATVRSEARTERRDLMKYEFELDTQAAEAQFGRDKKLVSIQAKIRSEEAKADRAFQAGENQKGREHENNAAKLRMDWQHREDVLQREWQAGQNVAERGAAMARTRVSAGGRGADGGASIGIPVEMQRYYALRGSLGDLLSGSTTLKPNPLDPNGPPTETRTPGLPPGPEREAAQRSLDEANAQIAVWEKIQGKAHRPKDAYSTGKPKVPDYKGMPLTKIDPKNTAELDAWIDANGTAAFVSKLQAMTGATPEQAMKKIIDYGARRQAKGAELLYPQSIGASQ